MQLKAHRLVTMGRSKVPRHVAGPGGPARAGEDQDHDSEQTTVAWAPRGAFLWARYQGAVTVAE